MSLCGRWQHLLKSLYATWTWSVIWDLAWTQTNARICIWVPTPLLPSDWSQTVRSRRSLREASPTFQCEASYNFAVKEFNKINRVENSATSIEPETHSSVAFFCRSSVLFITTMLPTNFKGSGKLQSESPHNAVQSRNSTFIYFKLNRWGILSFLDNDSRNNQRLMRIV